jgi:hypothetical protein
LGIAAKGGNEERGKVGLLVAIASNIINKHFTKHLLKNNKNGKRDL